MSWFADFNGVWIFAVVVENIKLGAQLKVRYFKVGNGLFFVVFRPLFFSDFNIKINFLGRRFALEIGTGARRHAGR